MNESLRSEKLETSDLDVTRSMAGGPGSDDPRLFAAIQEYMAALENGQHPPRRAFLARFPEIARELAACLDGLALVHSAAGEIAASSELPGTPAVDPALASGEPLGDLIFPTKSGRVPVRCQFCFASNASGLT